MSIIWGEMKPNEISEKVKQIVAEFEHLINDVRMDRTKSAKEIAKKYDLIDLDIEPLNVVFQEFFKKLAKDVLYENETESVIGLYLIPGVDKILLIKERHDRVAGYSFIEYEIMNRDTFIIKLMKSYEQLIRYAED